jgi:hypothetical protein
VLSLKKSFLSDGQTNVSQKYNERLAINKQAALQENLT